MLELRGRFKPEVAALSDYLGRDLVTSGAMTTWTELRRSRRIPRASRLAAGPAGEHQTTKERAHMPEAVIVDAIRTPIGRAGKGSLKSVRADDLAAIPLQALIERNPEARSGPIVDIMMGCGFCEGEQGYNVGRVAGLLAGIDHHVPATDRQPLLRVVAADGADGLPRDPGGRGRHLHRRRRRGGLARRRRHAVRVQPRCRRLAGRRLRRVHPDGHDRGERRRALQRQPRGAG